MPATRSRTEPELADVERLLDAVVWHLREEVAGVGREVAAGDEDDASGLFLREREDLRVKDHPAHSGHREVAEEDVVLRAVCNERAGT